MAAPDDRTLRAYLDGRLDTAAAAAVAAALEAMGDADAFAAIERVEGGSAPVPVAAAPAGFVSDLPRGRLVTAGELGRGGMAVVREAEDRVLGRRIAVKTLRPRGAEEPVEAFLLREAAFRREAAILAGLAHPAIPAVHDVGTLDGLPAIVLQRLDGRRFDAALQEGMPLGERIGLLLRIAEAVAHAHHRGVVHRDLTPGNILVGAFGAVHVLDWGLAARAGSGAGVRAGTPGWMAPEQERGDAADPRMDVFALGRLLRAAGGAVLPAGLAAVADRCTDPEPGNRYSDGAAVADELRRWIADGLTLAQEAAPWERALVRWRRSPRVRSAALAGLAAAAAIAGALAVRHIDETRNAQVRLAELERTPLSDAGALTAALAEVRAMRRTLPGLTEATALEARLGAAADLVRLQAEDDALRRRLGALLTRTRTVGPWADQVEAWRGALRAAGLALDGGSEDPERLRRHRLHRDLAAALPFLWRSEHEQVSATAAAQTAALLAAGGPDEGWRALGRLLGITRFAAHDPVFCHCEDAETVLAADGPAAVALALFAPEPRLAEAARVALIRQPGSFWPLIALARSRIAAGDGVGASRLAWTAAGAEPGSLLPHLLIAYAALDRSDGLDDLGAATDRAAAIAPGNLEVAALQAVARARAGRIAAAQAALDRIPAAHLRYHLEHPVGHPMERSVRAAVAAGLRIPDAAPEVGPLDRHSGH